MLYIAFICLADPHCRGFPSLITQFSTGNPGPSLAQPDQREGISRSFLRRANSLLLTHFSQVNKPSAEGIRITVQTCGIDVVTTWYSGDRTPSRLQSRNYRRDDLFAFLLFRRRVGFCALQNKIPLRSTAEMKSGE